MRGERLLGRVGISRPARGENAEVLAERPRHHRAREPAFEQDQVEDGVDPPVGVVDHRVAERRDDLEVEVAVEALHAADVVVGRLPAVEIADQRLVALFHGRDRRDRRRLGIGAHCGPFEDATDLVGVLGHGEVGLHHLDAGAGTDRHQPFGLEHPQRVAEGPDRHAQHLDQVVLREKRPWLQPAAVERFHEAVIGDLAEAPRLALPAAARRPVRPDETRRPHRGGLRDETP